MALMATAAFAQAQPGGAPGAASTQGAAAHAATQAAAPVPNLSGMWAHPYLTGFEPPVSGPGPVRNKSRLRNGVANFQKLVGDHTNPILKPEAAEVVKRHGEVSLAGEGYADAEQPVLARRRALRVLGLHRADRPAAGSNHDDLPPWRRSSPRAAERFRIRRR